MEIREFRPEDGKAVVELITSIMRSEFPSDEKAFPIDDLRDIPSHYGGRGEQFFVATVDNRIVGTVAVKHEDDRSALLRRIFVKPEYRNQKIGSKLIQRAVSFCRGNGYALIIFKTTSRMHRAIQLCQRNGFNEKAKITLGGIELLKFSYSVVNDKLYSPT